LRVPVVVTGIILLFNACASQPYRSLPAEVDIDTLRKVSVLRNTLNQYLTGRSIGRHDTISNGMLEQWDSAVVVGGYPGILISFWLYPSHDTSDMVFWWTSSKVLASYSHLGYYSTANESISATWDSLDQSLGSHASGEWAPRMRPGGDTIIVRVRFPVKIKF
jgi:hypothetical protein